MNFDKVIRPNMPRPLSTVVVHTASDARWRGIAKRDLTTRIGLLPKGGGSYREVHTKEINRLDVYEQQLRQRDRRLGRHLK